MKLAAESHTRLESFLREHLRDREMRLPPITIYSGFVARLLTSAFKIGAITFGRRVFVSPRLVKDDEVGRPTLPGWLAAHEAIHVLQYERAGFLRFLVTYLRGYGRALRAGGSWNAAAREAAYLAIAEECAAREAEAAYWTWNANTPEEREKEYAGRLRSRP
jgi:hypothetical protein